MRTLFVSIALLASGLSAADNPYHVTGRYPIGGAGSWDYVTLDGAARRLYVTHATQVEVLDADSGKIIGVIADTPGVHGVAIAQEFRRGFTTNGREDKVSVFDPATLATVQKIAVGKGPDGIYYDATTKRLFTCNHGSNDITAIDVATLKVVGTIRVEGAGESVVRGRDGLIYVNLEDKAEVAAFDPKSLDVKKRFPIGVAKTPTGLGYDPAANHLFIGCRESPTMVIMDAGSGKVVASFPIGAGVDWAYFDAPSKSVFASNGGSGTLSIFQQQPGGTYLALDPVKTQAGAKTMAFDPQTRRIFLPVAEYSAPRVVKPDTFGVLIVSQ